MTLYSLVKLCRQSFIDLLFPPLCVHCGEIIEDKAAICCTACSALMHFIEPKGRCLYCFNDLEHEKQTVCPLCLRKPTTFHRIAAVLDYMGPAATLIKKLKYGNQPHLAKGIGAFLAAQFIKLEWPMPDLVTSVPLSSSHLLQRGYNQSELIARSTAAFLGLSYKNILGRRNGGYSQASLPFQLRLELDKELFYLKKRTGIHDQTVLLIDDVITTGATFNHCGMTLLEQSPHRVYGLAFCKT